MSPKAHSEFWKLRRKFFLDEAQAASLFEVTTRTIRNWDRSGAPNWAMRRLYERDRRLDGLHPEWKGFKIGWNGKLYGPKGLQISPHHLARWRDLIRCPGCQAQAQAQEENAG